jgi:hypothetical protein
MPAAPRRSPLADAEGNVRAVGSQDEKRGAHLLKDRLLNMSKGALKPCSDMFLVPARLVAQKDVEANLELALHPYLLMKLIMSIWIVHAE